MTKREVERALSDLDSATSAYALTKKAHDEAREAVMKAALRALRLKTPPAEVARRSPFEPAYLRRKARDAGIPSPVRGKTLGISARETGKNEPEVQANDGGS